METAAFRIERLSSVMRRDALIRSDTVKKIWSWLPSVAEYYNRPGNPSRPTGVFGMRKKLGDLQVGHRKLKVAFLQVLEEKLDEAITLIEAQGPLVYTTQDPSGEYTVSLSFAYLVDALNIVVDATLGFDVKKESLENAYDRINHHTGQHDTCMSDTEGAPMTRNRPPGSPRAASKNSHPPLLPAINKRDPPDPSSDEHPNSSKHQRGKSCSDAKTTLPTPLKKSEPTIDVQRMKDQLLECRHMNQLRMNKRIMEKQRRTSQLTPEKDTNSDDKLPLPESPSHTEEAIRVCSGNHRLEVSSPHDKVSTSTFTVGTASESQATKQYLAQSSGLQQCGLTNEEISLTKNGDGINQPESCKSNEELKDSQLSDKSGGDYKSNEILEQQEPYVGDKKNSTGAKKVVDNTESDLRYAKKYNGTSIQAVAKPQVDWKITRNDRKVLRDVQRHRARMDKAKEIADKKYRKIPEPPRVKELRTSARKARNNANRSDDEIKVRNVQLRGKEAVRKDKKTSNISQPNDKGNRHWPEKSLKTAQFDDSYTKSNPAYNEDAGTPCAAVKGELPSDTLHSFTPTEVKSVIATDKQNVTPKDEQPTVELVAIPAEQSCTPENEESATGTDDDEEETASLEECPSTDCNCVWRKSVWSPYQCGSPYVTKSTGNLDEYLREDYDSYYSSNSDVSSQESNEAVNSEVSSQESNEAVNSEVSSQESNEVVNLEVSSQDSNEAVADN